MTVKNNRRVSDKNNLETQNVKLKPTLLSCFMYLYSITNFLPSRDRLRNTPDGARR